MTNIDMLSVLIVVTLGLFFGTVIGLLIGFLAKQQSEDWQAMTARQKLINTALVTGCSLISIAGLAWYAFR